MKDYEEQVDTIMKHFDFEGTSKMIKVLLKEGFEIPTMDHMKGSSVEELKEYSQSSLTDVVRRANRMKSDSEIPLAQTISGPMCAAVHGDVATLSVVLNMAYGCAMVYV